MTHNIGDLVLAFYFGDTAKPMIGIITAIRVAKSWNNFANSIRYEVLWQYTHNTENTHSAYAEADVDSFKENLEFFKRKL